MNVKEEEFTKLLKKINIKLSLILGEEIRQSEKSIRSQVTKLAKSNLDYNDIAEVLGITPAHAAKELSELRRGINNGKKPKE